MPCTGGLLETRRYVWFSLVILWSKTIYGATLECFYPLCNQGTAFYSNSLGSVPGLHFFLDAEDREGILQKCALIRRETSTQDIITWSRPIHICTKSPKSDHFLVDLSSFGDNTVGLSEAGLVGTTLSVRGLFHYANASVELTPVRYFFIQSNAEYDLGAAQRDPVAAHLRNPPYGTVATSTFRVDYDISEHSLRNSSTLHLHVNEVFQADMSVASGHASAVGDTDGAGRPRGDGRIEPGSWFFSLQPIEPLTSLQPTLPNFGYVEFVLEASELQQQRVFSTPKTHMPPLLSSAAASPRARPGQLVDHGDDKVHVCIWASNVLDGQKRIFLQQISNLPEGFTFTYFMASPSLATSQENLTLSQLQTMNDLERNLYELSRQPAKTGRRRIQVVDSPTMDMRIDSSFWVVPPDDGAVPLSGTESEEEVLQYMAARLQAANGKIDSISPEWVKSPYKALRSAMLEHQCDVSVHGNVRGTSPDSFLIGAARELGIPTVAELLNLYVDADSSPDLLIAPSLYAMEHESVKWLRDAKMADSTCTAFAGVRVVPDSFSSGIDELSLDVRRFECGPVTTIVTPAVDLSAFTLRKEITSELIDAHFRDCYEQKQECKVVGFMARLSTEKNPGLFLLMAHRILQQDKNVRFVMIGAGPALIHLIDLAKRLRISKYVAFPGWIAHDDLPRALSGLNVLVNPSIRGWSETFCIANIEAMAVGVPLVTFAVGGVGQYVRRVPTTSSSSSSNNTTTDSFSVEANAIVVHDPRPFALADAVTYVLRESGVADALTKAARQTVEEGFDVELQMLRYEYIYRSLANVKNEIK
eukprot:GSChrysophyteH1.ASY1.ANO1.750.1 assembled CDS